MSDVEGKVRTGTLQSSSRQQQRSDLVLDYQLDAEWNPETNRTTVKCTTTGQCWRQRLVTTTETWERVLLLGHGASGTVWKERIIEDPSSQGGTNGGEEGCAATSAVPRVRVVKEIRTDRSYQDVDDLVHCEMEGLVKFSHDRFSHCFVRCLGWYASITSLYVAMEHIPLGNLQDSIRGLGPLPEDEVKKIAAQVLEGLHLLHKNRYVHSDLNPCNIFVFCKCPDWFVKLSGFGCRKLASTPRESRTRVGTLAYLAPEILGLIAPGNDAATDCQAAEPVISFPVDIWALGEVVHYLLTNQPVFGTPQALRKYVTEVTVFSTDSPDSTKASSQSLDFIQKVMAVSPAKRPTAKEALEHEWLAKYLVPGRGAESSLSEIELNTETSAESEPTPGLPDQLQYPATVSDERDEDGSLAETVVNGNLMSGSLRYRWNRSGGLPRNFRYQEQWFWLGSDEAVHLARSDYVTRGADTENAKRTAAWAAHTGKGLLFVGPVHNPVVAINLADAGDMVVDSPTKFHFLARGLHHTFKANSKGEADGWISRLDRMRLIATGIREQVLASKEYQSYLGISSC